MSSYDEYLISQAGGDGDDAMPDEFGNYINHKLAAECDREIAAISAALEATK